MSFRMSSVQFMTNYQASLNRTYQQQAKLLEKGDGSSIHRGSDDPIGYSKLLRYKVSANENDQYKTNVQAAQAWMETTDGALTHITDITKTFKEKTVAAANDYNNDTDFDAIAKEMYALIEEVVATGNVQHGAAYVFSGQQSLTQPFELSDKTYQRAETRTLDQAQANFFLGTTSTDPSDLHQFVKVADDDGVEYFLDTTNGMLYNRGLVDSEYLDKNYTGKNYKEIMAEEYASGHKFQSVNDIIEHVPKSEWASYGVHNIGAYVDSDTATTAISNIVNIDLTVDSDTNITNTTNNLTKFLNQTVYGFSSDTNVIQSLANLESYTNSDTMLSKITSDTGVQSAIKNFVSDNQSVLNRYKASSSYYFDTSGLIKGDTTTFDFTVDGVQKSLTMQTKSQNIVTYFGDANKISMVKNNGPTDTAADVVNAVGSDMFGTDMFDNYDSGYMVPSGAAMVNNMLAVYEHVKAGDVDWLHHDGILLADAANATVTNSQTTVGARLQLYNNVEDMLDNMSDNITEQITDVSGTDVAKLATNLMEMTTLYNMALALGGRVLPQSLADYL